jgi:hypothetical protein
MIDGKSQDLAQAETLREFRVNIGQTFVSSYVNIDVKVLSVELETNILASEHLLLDGRALEVHTQPPPHIECVFF